MTPKKKICISLSEQDYTRIQALADESFRTRAGYIRHLIRVYLRHIEKHPEQKLK